ncbi:DNA polymerase III subunit chi [soil metagenome]
MTRIDFHTKVSDKLLYTCRLIRKASAANCRIVVFDDNQQQLSLLNEMLWTFSELDFLPHVFSNDPLAIQTPIILTDTDSADLPHHELLINLSQATPDNFQRFERMIEVISTDTEDTRAGRIRYRNYQQQGLAPTHIEAKPT